MISPISRNSGTATSTKFVAGPQTIWPMKSQNGRSEKAKPAMLPRMPSAAALELSDAPGRGRGGRRTPAREAETAGDGAAAPPVEVAAPAGRHFLDEDVDGHVGTGIEGPRKAPGDADAQHVARELGGRLRGKAEE